MLTSKDAFLRSYLRARSYLRSGDIVGPFPPSFGENLSCFHQPFKQTGGLKGTYSAKIRRIPPFNAPMLSNVSDHHLFLLNRIESSLAHVFWRHLVDFASPIALAQKKLCKNIY
jgi:hypothetical protein